MKKQAPFSRIQSWTRRADPLKPTADGSGIGASLHEDDGRVPDRGVLLLTQERGEREAQPGEPPGRAQPIELVPGVSVDARRQHVRLPRPRRHGEPFQPLEGGGGSLLALAPFAETLPVQQEAHVVGHADGLHLTA
jgi:hypothetical protein